MFKLISLDTRLATGADAHLPAYDNTKLSAVNTCPTWGIIRYSHHKKMPGAYRSMALEAGTASHEAFAAVRWYQYRYYQCHTKAQLLNSELHGTRLFGADRFDVMKSSINTDSTERSNIINFAIAAVETSGFYDDISDTKRTVSNICEALISYVDAYDMERYPVWVRDPDDPNTDIGIEIAYDIVITIKYADGLGEAKELTCRFTGKLDGLHLDPKKDNHLVVIDEKTGARLDDAWLAQWVLSHQITGYCVASTTFTNMNCQQAIISGMRLPIGKIAAEGIRKEHVNRSQELINKWAGWFVSSVMMEQKWREHVLDAPTYTHSCNRYFSSCSFLPLCAADNIEEKKLILSEMELDEWSPLHE